MTSLDSQHTWQFTIDGLDVTQYVDPNSVTMTDAEGAEVDTLYLELQDVAGSLAIMSWQETVWTIDSGEVSELVWFGGFVVNVERSSLNDSQGVLWRVKCEGYGTLPARLPARTRSWVDAYPGDIVIDLLDQVGLTSQDTEQGTLSYQGNDTTTAVLRDTGQTWSDWDTSTGDAAYAVVVTNTDGTVSWGYLGALSTSDITVYQDLALTTRGWNGVLPVGGSKTPESYRVRRGELFSGHRPFDTTNVQTGDNALLSFGTIEEESVAKVFDRLAKQLGWVWRVDGEAAVYFGEDVNDPAPFNVSDGANATYVSNEYYPARAGTFMISSSNGMEIRNRVLIHGGAKASAEINEMLWGNATTRIYQLAHHNLIDITVLVNGAVVADGTVWWNTFDDRIVLVNYAEGWIWFVEDFLILGDTITVIYRYWIALEYEERDETSIAQHRQVFTYELTDRTITSEERAQDVAAQILSDYSGDRYTGSFEVWRLGLRAGQNIKLKFTDFDIDTGFVIRKMDCRIDPSNTGLVVYCEFGDREQRLSELAGPGGSPSVDMVSLRQLGPYFSSARAAIAKPISSSAATLAKQYSVMVDATSNNVDLSLPPALTRIGDSILVVRIDTSAEYVVTLTSSGFETINGASSYEVPNSGYEAVLCYSDGAAWYGLRMKP